MKNDIKKLFKYDLARIKAIPLKSVASAVVLLVLLILPAIVALYSTVSSDSDTRPVGYSDHAEAMQEINDEVEELRKALAGPDLSEADRVDCEARLKQYETLAEADIANHNCPKCFGIFNGMGFFPQYSEAERGADFAFALLQPFSFVMLALGVVCGLLAGFRAFDGSLKNVLAAINRPTYARYSLTTALASLILCWLFIFAGGIGAAAGDAHAALVVFTRDGATVISAVALYTLRAVGALVAANVSASLIYLLCLQTRSLLKGGAIGAAFTLIFVCALVVLEQILVRGNDVTIFEKFKYIPLFSLFTPGTYGDAATYIALCAHALAAAAIWYAAHRKFIKYSL